MSATSLRELLRQVAQNRPTDDDLQALSVGISACQSAGDLELCRVGSVLLVEALTFRARPDDAIAAIQTALRFTDRTLHSNEWLRLRFAEGLCLYQNDDLVSAIRSYSHVRHQGRILGHATHELRGIVGVAMCTVMLGDATAVQQLLDASSHLLADASRGVGVAYWLCQVRTYIESGLFGQARSTLQPFLDTPPTGRMALALRMCDARLLVHEGHFDRAYTQACELAECGVLKLPWEVTSLHLIMAKAAHALGDRARTLQHLGPVFTMRPVTGTRTHIAEAYQIRARVRHSDGDVSGMWEDIAASTQVLRNATVGTVGHTVHALVDPLMEEIDHLRGVEFEALNKDLVRTVDALTEANQRLSAEVNSHQETQEVLHRTHRKLVRTAHDAGMAEVATGVLHDLGNAMNSISVSVSLARRAASLKTDTYLQRIGEEIQRELGADHRLGDFAIRLGQRCGAAQQDLTGNLERIDTGIAYVVRIIAAQQRAARMPQGLEELNLRSLVNDALEIGLGTSGAGVQLTIEVEVDLCVISAANRLLRILVNLIQNARDAMRGCEGNDLLIRASLSPGVVHVDVIDGGSGVPESLEKHIFRHGFTTKSTGSGFGLHASATAAAELGGSLELMPTPEGGGAHFRLVLPLQTAGVRLELPGLIGPIDPDAPIEP